MVEQFKFIKEFIEWCNKKLDKHYRDTNLQQQLIDEIIQSKALITDIKGQLDSLAKNHILKDKFSLSALECPIFQSNKNNLDRLPVEMTKAITTCHSEIKELLQQAQKYNNSHDALINSMIESGLSTNNLSNADFSKLTSYKNTKEYYKKLAYIGNQINQNHQYLKTLDTFINNNKN